MKFKIGDNVIIKQSSECDSEPMDEKYIGKKGLIVDIHEDRPCAISINVNYVGTDGFHEEELELDI